MSITMTNPRLDILGAAFADPSRSRILCELMDGRAFTNKELACAANITAQTASAHLKQLKAAGLTVSLRSGRCTYHQIAGVEVARALEVLASLSPTDHLRLDRYRRCKDAHALIARSCYNHIAGRLGVLMTERMIAANALTLSDGNISLGTQAIEFFRQLDVEVPQERPREQPSVTLCLDWTERRHHISGPLATALMKKALEMGWLERRTGSRALTISTSGYEIFANAFGLSHEEIHPTT